MQRAWVEGDTSELVPDLCHELDRELTWAEYGETVIPSRDAASSMGQSPHSSGEHVYGGLLVSLDPNQPASRVQLDQRQAGRVGGSAYTDAACDDGPGRSRPVHRAPVGRVRRAGSAERPTDGRGRRWGGLGVGGLGFRGLGMTWR